MNGWMEFVFGVAISTLMVGVMLAGGARLRRWLRLPSPAGLRPTVDLVLGSWLLASLALVAGMAGIFGPGVLITITLAVTAMGNWRGLLRRLQPIWPVALAALPLFIIAGAPPFFYDAWVYHLGLPWQALNDGAISAHPENIFAAFPPLAQLIYAFPLSVGALRAPAIIHLALFVSGAHAVAVLARRLGASRPVSILAGIAMLYLPVSTLVPGLPIAEGWALAGLVAAATVALTGRADRPGAVLAGLLAGTALAARLQGLPWCVLLIGALWLREPSNLRRPTWTTAAAVGGAFPWWIKNAVLLGDPWAPLGWHREGIETLWRDAGAAVFEAGGWWTALPTIHASLVDVGWLLVPVLACGVAAYLLRRKIAILLVVSLSITGAFLWAGTGSLPRFLVPSLAMGMAAAAALPRPSSRVAALLLAVVGSFGLARTLVQISVLGGIHLLGGDATTYASPHATQLIGNPYPAFHSAESLPASARVLFVCEPRGFLFPRPFVTTSQHDVSILREILEESEDPAGAVVELRRRGFSHLLINIAEQRRLSENYPVEPWRDIRGFERATAFFRSLGEPVVDKTPVKIWALTSTR
jgi:hypothetical protein